eukprot:3598779-Prymnesium_polylepis.1
MVRIDGSQVAVVGGIPIGPNGVGGVVGGGGADGSGGIAVGNGHGGGPVFDPAEYSKSAFALTPAACPPAGYFPSSKVCMYR